VLQSGGWLNPPGFLFPIGDKLALARFLFIIQNSREQFTVHSLQFTVVIKNALTVNCRRSTVDLCCQSSVVRLEPLPMLDRRLPLRYRGARCKEVAGDCPSPPRDRMYRQ
jgi:hypothetical protein